MATTPRPAPITDPPANQPRFLPASSQPGGLATGPVLQSTTLGVPPPPKPTPSQRIPITVAPPPAPRSSRVWLAVGALLAIAAGIALAIALVG